MGDSFGKDSMGYQPLVKEQKIYRVVNAKKEDQPVRVEKVDLGFNLEDLRKLAEAGFAKRDNDGKDKDLWTKYPEQYKGKLGESFYDIQFADAKLVSGFPTETVDGVAYRVTARVWINEGRKGQDEGESKAMQYSVLENGMIVKGTATHFKLDKEKNTTYWTVGAVKQMTATEVGVEVNDRLKEFVDAKEKQQALQEKIDKAQQPIKTVTEVTRTTVYNN